MGDRDRYNRGDRGRLSDDRQHHHSSSRKKEKSSHHRSPTPTQDDYYYAGSSGGGGGSGAPPSTSSHDYKQLYKEARHDLKRKRHDLEEFEKSLDREKRETKKAKQDTADLWKIYYTLQQELQQSYERNAKIQSEKATLEAESEERKKNDEVAKAEGADNPEKMREALFAMQKQKIEMQTKFNEIVLENKRLKEKECTYEPRLRELENLKERLNEALAAIRELTEVSSRIRGDLREASFSIEEVEKFRRWNSMLMLEGQQKTQKIAHLSVAEEYRDRLAELTKTVQVLRAGLGRMIVDVKQLKMDACGWSGGAIKDTLAEMTSLLFNTKGTFDQFADTVTKIDITWVTALNERLSMLPSAFGDDKEINLATSALISLIAERTKGCESNNCSNGKEECPVEVHGAQ